MEPWSYVGQAWCENHLSGDQKTQAIIVFHAITTATHLKYKSVICGSILQGI